MGQGAGKPASSGSASGSTPGSASGSASGSTSSRLGGSGAPVVEADVDGARVRICARDEVVIQCGKASITLRRNGRVVIRGTYVETHSEGTNRIRGGQVRVN
jgi:hypothetical protein